MPVTGSSFVLSERKKIDFGQVDLYTLRGGGVEQWEPRFTWHTFRYIEVISRQVRMNKESLVAKVVHTDPQPAGSFSCSNELFNKINEVYLRTQKNNFHGSISSDCPHRERLAYTGDAQVVVESSILSFDMTQFYRKWFDDIGGCPESEERLCSAYRTLRWWRRRSGMGIGLCDHALGLLLLLWRYGFVEPSL